MTDGTYGLVQCGNRFYYSIGAYKAFAIQIKPFPAAWVRTPSTTWKRTHRDVLYLDSLGLGLGPSSLELHPLVDWDRSGIEVFRFVPSNDQFELEPDWSDSIQFTEWAEGYDWREILIDLMRQIDRPLLERLCKYSYSHLALLESIHSWPEFESLLCKNRALAVCVAARIRVGAQKGEKRSRLDYNDLVQRTEREISYALGFGGSDDIVEILRKLPPDTCTRYSLIGIARLLENLNIRTALRDASEISYPVLSLLRNPLLQNRMSPRFISECARLFPYRQEILTCPWRKLLRGGGKADLFMHLYRQAIDVVLYAADPTIHSLQDLDIKWWKIHSQRPNTALSEYEYWDS